MNESRQIRTVIVGGGFGGLALALCLHQRGISRITVLEKTASCAQGRDDGVIIHPYASRILKGIGLYSNLAENGLPLESTCLHINDESCQAAIPLFQAEYGFSFSIRVSTILQLLYEACLERNIEVIFNIHSLEIEPTDQFVQVNYENANQSGFGEFDLLVAADGIQSSIRNKFFPDVCVETSKTATWSFVRPGIAEYRDHSIHEYLLRNKVARIVPLPDGSMWVTCTSFKPKLCNAGNLKEHYKSWSLGTKIFSEIPSTVDFRQNVSVQSDYKWHSGRIVLLADAAHGLLPIGTHGVGLAFESAAVLADELTRSGRSLNDLTQAFYFYQQRRIPRVLFLAKDVEFCLNSERTSLAISLFARKHAVKAVGSKLSPWLVLMRDLYNIPL